MCSMPSPSPLIVESEVKMKKALDGMEKLLKEQSKVYETSKDGSKQFLNIYISNDSSYPYI